MNHARIDSDFDAYKMLNNIFKISGTRILSLLLSLLPTISVHTFIATEILLALNCRLNIIDIFLAFRHKMQLILLNTFKICFPLLFDIDTSFIVCTVDIIQSCGTTIILKCTNYLQVEFISCKALPLDMCMLYCNLYLFIDFFTMDSAL